MKLFNRISAGIFVLALSGCGSLSGIGGTSSLSCPLPNGALCKPITEVYKMPLKASADAAQATIPMASQAATTTYTPTTGEEYREPLVSTSDASKALVAKGGTSVQALPTAPGLTRYEPSPGLLPAASRVAPSSGAPIRSAAKMLRIWLAPYEDDEGALRDHGYMYVMVDPGKWQVEYNQQRIMKQYAPIVGPKSLGKSGGMSGGQDAPQAPPRATMPSASAFPFLPSGQAAGNGTGSSSGNGNGNTAPGIYSEPQGNSESVTPSAPTAPLE
jgi:conjugal transfer pilus assembly protein TraV